MGVRLKKISIGISKKKSFNSNWPVNQFNIVSLYFFFH